MSKFGRNCDIYLILDFEDLMLSKAFLYIMEFPNVPTSTSKEESADIGISLLLYKV